MIRGGHHLGDKNFYPRNAAGHDAAQIIEAFISQHYLDRAAPPVIISSADFARDTLEHFLSEQVSHKVQIIVNPAGERRAWLDMAIKNATLGAQQQLGLHATQEARLQALQQALDTTEAIQRIECFDVSHTMGEATVASCVVYDKAALQKSEYRRFNIAGIEPGDDYAAMRDVLSRRYRRVVAGESKLPDLVLIDGGKGQLGVACEDDAIGARRLVDALAMVPLGLVLTCSPADRSLVTREGFAAPPARPSNATNRRPTREATLHE